MAATQLLAKIKWAQAGSAISGATERFVATWLQETAPAERPEVLVRAAALALEQEAHIEVTVPPVPTMDAQADAWIMLAAAAKRLAPDQREPFLTKVLQEAAAAVTARRSVSIPRESARNSPSPMKPPPGHGTWVGSTFVSAP